MIIEPLISYLSQVKGYLQGGEKKLMIEPIDDIVKCLEEGKKYKKLCEGIEDKIVYDAHGNYKHNWSEELIGLMNKLKREVFSGLGKEIIINIEAKDEKELFRQLDKARYLIQDRLQYVKFCNFDVCGEKVQVIIKDKEVIK